MLTNNRIFVCLAALLMATGGAEQVLPEPPHTTGAFPEILGDAGIAYSPNNAHTLADALEKLLTDPECLSTCSANARHLSKNRYNDELTASQLLHVYRDLRN